MRARRSSARSRLTNRPVSQQGHNEPDTVLAQFRLIDDAMPVMLAYVDRELRYRYHNRAFRDWLARDASQINGRTMPEALGESLFAELAARVNEAILGHAIRYQSTHKTRNGGVARLFIHLVPRIGDDGKVLGLYFVIVNQSTPAPAEAPARPPRPVPSVPAPAAPAPVPPAPVAPAANSVNQAQALYDASIDVELTGWQNAADRIRSAIRNDEFHLYAQAIMDLQSDGRRFYEVYMRMAEEEENMMPPGAFLPLAEKYGLMRALDRWVVTAVLKSVVGRREAEAAWAQAAYCINLSRDTIGDPYFPDFVRAQLTAFDVPGEALRFELQEADVLANPADAAHLVQQLSRLDCWSVLCGFGRDKVSFDILKDLPVGFLKIDSSIVLRMLRDDSALAKLKSINRVAHTVGINTIAEFVESEAMIAKLREVGIDYAQGLAIGVPMPLKDVL